MRELPCSPITIRERLQSNTWRSAMRKNLLMGVALAVLGLTSLGLIAQTEKKDTTGRAPTAAPDQHHAMYAACAKVCAECMLTCEMTAHHCAEAVMAGKKEHAKAMKLTGDCAEFCALSAKMTASHSELAPAACEACAKACDLCAAECLKFADMPEMKTCAESCKKCAASCREMMKHSK